MGNIAFSKNVRVAGLFRSFIRNGVNVTMYKKDRQMRVLQVVTAMSLGGIQSFVMNVYRNIDRDAIQFDFLYHRTGQFYYDDEIANMGGKIYRAPRCNPVDPRYYHALNSLFKQSSYDAVHSHINCMSAPALKMAYKNSVPVRIAHSHSSNTNTDYKYPVKLAMRHLIPKYATHLLACGENAGKWLFCGKDFDVVNNGIDTESFVYSDKKRQIRRAELGLPTDGLVVIHVGRFSPVKNHIRILDIFGIIQKKREDARLILVGEGPTMDDVREKADAFGMNHKILFLGPRTDVGDLESAADVFLMPSLFEGLPLALVEAQTSGLRCVVSDAVPCDCDVTDLVTRVRLDDGDEVWADVVIREALATREDHSEEVKEAGFDAKNVATRLMMLYSGDSA